MHKQSVYEADGPPSPFLVGVVRTADGINRVIGHVVAWLVLGTVLVCFATVYARYALGVNFIWLQEIYTMQHAAVIVLSAGYTMMTGGFVRVDLLYSKWPKRRQAIMDMWMTLLLLFPFLAVFGWFSWRFFLNSYMADEGSLNPGGLPDLWLLKATFLGLVALIALQGLAFVARGLLVMRGHEEFALAQSGHDPEAAS